MTWMPQLYNSFLTFGFNFFIILDIFLKSYQIILSLQLPIDIEKTLKRSYSAVVKIFAN